MSERRRKFWGWGYEDDEVPAEELAWFEKVWSRELGIAKFEVTPPPRLEEISLRAPRITIPTSLRDVCTTEKWDRVFHTYGSSGRDTARVMLRDYSNPPDVVAYPRDETDIIDLFDWCNSVDAAAIPFGGGSGVVGGIEPPQHERYRGAVTISLRNFNKVLEIDTTSQAARIQSGVLGPSLEEQLRPSGLTLRFFLQAWEFSSLGGWIATRAAGHFATLYTQIEDHVENLRVVTPAGVLESRRLPASGAGPSPDRMFIGSEGALGIITEAWLRLHRRPKFRASTTVRFKGFYQAADAVRAISQAGLYPANCRLVEAAEARFTEAGDGTHDLLVLSFESADHPVDPWMTRALELCTDHGGKYDKDALEKEDAHRSGAAGAWRDKFLRGPYYREHQVARGVMRDTVESAIPWSRFKTFDTKVREAGLKAIKEVTGRNGTFTCRFTHIYPDGPAPYYTWHAYGDKAKLPEQFLAIRSLASDAMIENGGTITHHHALGRVHRPWYDRQRPELFAKALSAAKQVLDPKWILNPGVLVDPPKTQ
jgi:alkyldihydroxyacetonephosphate synthase